MYNDLNERNFRHDLTLSASRFLSPDSMSAITGNLYYTRINWNRDLTDSILWDRSFPDFIDYVNHYYGANAKYEQNIKGLILRAGGDIHGYELPATQINKKAEGVNYSAFAHAQYNLGDDFNVAGGYRFNKKFKNTSSSIGGRLFFKISPKIEIIGDISAFERIPSLTEGINLKKERTLLSFAEVRWSDNINYITINGYYRLINNPLITKLFINESGVIQEAITENSSPVTITGASADIKILALDNLFLSTGKLFIAAKIQGNLKGDLPIVPDLYSSLMAYYEMRISKSLLHVGIMGSIISKSSNCSLFQLKRLYGELYNPETFMYDGINAFASARLGNAFVRVGFNNIISTNFYYMPVYPVLPRSFILSLNWSFFD
jgi:hypothetical protein